MKNKNNNKFKYIFLFVAIIMVFFVFKSDLAISQYENIDEEIQMLNDQIQAQKRQLESIQKSQEEYSKLIKRKEQEQNTLSNQLDILDDKLKKAELDIEGTTLEISKNTLEIKKIEIDIDNKNKRIEQDKNNISALLRLLDKQSQTSPLEIILLNSSLADFINQITYLENTNRELGESIVLLKDSKNKLDQQMEILEEKKISLDDLKKKLEHKRNALEGEIINKEFILTETKNSEQEYKKLLSEAKKQNDQAMADIASLEISIRKKLAEKKDDGLEEELNGFAWPVTKNVITSTFHDPSYPFRRTIGEHSGIDIRAAQGTTLRAAASGYVARVKFDGSTNYAYVMIIHADNFSTVYGHVSAVSVSEDEYVVQGQVIGKTGGAPRTPGAGPFSTGPHLHFEVRKNGIPTNPLNYLQ